MIDCESARPHLLDLQRGRLAGALGDDVRAHLRSCTTCARLSSNEATLTEVLEARLPQHPASTALKRRLAAEWAAASPEWAAASASPARSAPAPTARPSRWRTLAPVLAIAAVVLLALPVVYRGVMNRQEGSPMVTEAVNDHLRVLQSQHPLDVASGGLHQVKPWFAGRLDFAPVVAFEGDRDVSLEGGAVGYFIDRKAAVFVYKLRAHTISLFVFRADGLPWPPARESTTNARGFSVVLWRSGELGYALVSDADARELVKLAGKISGG